MTKKDEATGKAAGERTARFGLDITPLPALSEAVEDKDYFSARVPKSYIAKFRTAQAAEGEKHGWRFFMKVLDFYLEHHSPK
jgi:hypothetical protein